MPYFDWLLNDWRVVREHPRLAVALLMIGALSAWSLRGGTISNLQSQVDLLRFDWRLARRLPAVSPT